MYYIIVTDKQDTTVQTFHDRNEVIARRIYNYLLQAADMQGYTIRFEKGM